MEVIGKEELADIKAITRDQELGERLLLMLYCLL